MENTLEKKFTQEDMGNLGNLIGEAVRMIAEDETSFQPELVYHFVIGLTPHKDYCEYAMGVIDILKRKYQEVIGKEYPA
jgi:hypothetical protein